MLEIVEKEFWNLWQCQIVGTYLLVLRPWSCVLFTVFDSWSIFSAKIYFMKTSARIGQCKSGVIKLNPDF